MSTSTHAIITQNRVTRGRKYIVWTLFILFLLIFSIWQMKRIPIDSDYANLVLEANDILSGNIFRKGWILTGISFLTTDVPYFLVGALVGGISVKAYYIAAGLMVAVALILGGKLCRRETQDWPGLLFYFLITGIPCWFAMSVLRAHTGSVSLLYAALPFIDRLLKGQGKQKSSEILVFIFLTLGCMSDSVIMIWGSLPLIIYFCFWMANHRRDSSGFKNHLAMVLLTIGSLVFGFLLNKIYFRIGGAVENSFLSNRSFEPMENWGNKFIIWLRSLLLIFDADFGGQAALSVRTAAYLINTLILILGISVTIYTVLRMIKGKETDVISATLSVGFILLSLLFILTDIAIDENSSRYMATCLYALPVLIVRNRKWLLSGVKQKKAVAVISMLLAAVSFAYRGWLILSERSIASSIPQARAAAYLEEIGAEDGYASFWNASSITVLSEGKVSVSAIIENDQHYDRFNWFCKEEWYQGESHFIITSENDPRGITYENTLAIMGQPSEILEFDPYRILVYTEDLSYRLRCNALKDHQITGTEFSRNDKVILTDDVLRLEKGGIIFGPYINLPKGSYRLQYSGKGLSSARIDLFSGLAEKQIEMQTREWEDDRIVCFAEVTENLANAEFRLFNDTDELMELDVLYVDPVGEVK